MSTTERRKEFETAIWHKNSSKIRELLQWNDTKELLLMKHGGCLPIHEACSWKLDKSCLQLILDAAVEHGITKQMLEENDDEGKTCLHLSCFQGLSCDSLRLLLEYLSKYADIKKVLEVKDKHGSTCLHLACADRLPSDSLCVLLEYSSKHGDIKKMLQEKTGGGATCLNFASLLGAHFDSLRLLISFLPSKEILEKDLAIKDNKNKTLIDHTTRDELKQLLQDPDCWQKCRLWLLQNHEDIFLYSLYPKSFEKTCQALKELLKNGLQRTKQHATIMLIALMSSPSKFRAAVLKTNSLAIMSIYFDVVKKGVKKSDYHHWRKNIHLFREFYGQWPSSERKTASTYDQSESEVEGRSCSCVIQ